MHSAYEALTEANVIALPQEPLLLNEGDYSQADRLQAQVVVAVSEPALLNRDVNQELVEEKFAPTSEHLDVLPSTVATLNIPHARVVVDDDGVPLFDVDYTGTAAQVAIETPVHESELALDGFEDR